MTLVTKTSIPVDKSQTPRNTNGSTKSSKSFLGVHGIQVCDIAWKDVWKDLLGKPPRLPSWAVDILMDGRDIPAEITTALYMNASNSRHDAVQLTIMFAKLVKQTQEKYVAEQEQKMARERSVHDPEER
jgi:hypothetical protein